MSGDRLAAIEAECKRRIADRELRPQIRGEARDVLALVEIAKAARVGSQTWKGSRRMMPQAIAAIDLALARLDSGAAEGDA